MAVIFAPLYWPGNSLNIPGIRPIRERDSFSGEYDGHVEIMTNALIGTSHFHRESAKTQSIILNDIPDFTSSVFGGEVFSTA